MILEVIPKHLQIWTYQQQLTQFFGEGIYLPERPLHKHGVLIVILDRALQGLTNAGTRPCLPSSFLSSTATFYSRRSWPILATLATFILGVHVYLQVGARQILCVEFTEVEN